jgi:hypothetical protein
VEIKKKEKQLLNKLPTIYRSLNQKNVSFFITQHIQQRKSIPFYLHNFFCKCKTNDLILMSTVIWLKKVFSLFFFIFIYIWRLHNSRAFIIFHMFYLSSVISSANTHVKKNAHLKPNWPLYCYKLKWMFFFSFEIKEW